MADSLRDTAEAVERLDQRVSKLQTSFKGVTESVGGMKQGLENIKSRIDDNARSLNDYYTTIMRTERGLQTIGISSVAYRRALSDIHKETNLSREETTKFFSQLESGIKGLRDVSTMQGVIKNLAEIGRTAEETGRMIGSLTQAQNQFVDVMARLNSGGSLNLTERLKLDPQVVRDMDMLSLKAKGIWAGDTNQQRYLADIQKMNKVWNDTSLQLKEALVPVMKVFATNITKVGEQIQPLISMFSSFMNSGVGPAVAGLFALNTALKFIGPGLFTLSRGFGMMGSSAASATAATTAHTTAAAASAAATAAAAAGLHSEAAGHRAAAAAIRMHTAELQANARANRMRAMGSVVAGVGSMAAMAGGGYLATNGESDETRAAGGALMGAGIGLQLGMYFGPVVAILTTIAGSLVGFLGQRWMVGKQKEEAARKEETEKLAKSYEESMDGLEKGLQKSDQYFSDRLKDIIASPQHMNMGNMMGLQVQKLQQEKQYLQEMLAKAESRGDAQKIGELKDALDRNAAQSSPDALKQSVMNQLADGIREADNRLQNFNDAIDKAVGALNNMASTSRDWGLDGGAAASDFFAASNAERARLPQIRERAALSASYLPVAQQNVADAQTKYENAAPEEKTKAYRELQAAQQDLLNTEGDLASMRQQIKEATKNSTESMIQGYTAGVNVAQKLTKQSKEHAEQTERLTNAMRLGMGPSYEAMMQSLSASKSVIMNTQSEIEQLQKAKATLLQQLSVEKDINQQKELRQALNQVEYQQNEANIRKQGEMADYLEKFNKTREGYIDALSGMSIGGMDYRFDANKNSGLVHFMEGGHSLVGTTNGGGFKEATTMGRFGTANVGENGRGAHFSKNERDFNRSLGLSDRDASQLARGHGDMSKFFGQATVRGQNVLQHGDGGIHSGKLGPNSGRSAHAGVTAGGMDISAEGNYSGGAGNTANPTPVGTRTGAGNALGAAAIGAGYTKQGPSVIGEDEADVAGDFIVKGNLIIKGDAKGTGGGGGGGGGSGSGSGYGVAGGSVLGGSTSVANPAATPATPHKTVTPDSPTPTTTFPAGTPAPPAGAPAPQNGQQAPITKEEAVAIRREAIANLFKLQADLRKADDENTLPELRKEGGSKAMLMNQENLGDRAKQILAIIAAANQNGKLEELIQAAPARGGVAPQPQQPQQSYGTFPAPAVANPSGINRALKRHERDKKIWAQRDAIHKAQRAQRDNYMEQMVHGPQREEQEKMEAVTQQNLASRSVASTGIVNGKKVSFTTGKDGKLQMTEIAAGKNTDSKPMVFHWPAGAKPAEQPKQTATPIQIPEAKGVVASDNYITDNTAWNEKVKAQNAQLNSNQNTPETQAALKRFNDAKASRHQASIAYIHEKAAKERETEAYFKEQRRATLAGKQDHRHYDQIVEKYNKWEHDARVLRSDLSFREFQKNNEAAIPENLTQGIKAPAMSTPSTSRASVNSTPTTQHVHIKGECNTCGTQKAMENVFDNAGINA